MHEQITLTLSREALTRAERWAQRIGRPVSEVLSQVVESSLNPLGPHEEQPALATRSDEVILAATETQLPPDLDRRLSELLDIQQRRSLLSEEQNELRRLMVSYEEGLLSRAQSLAEAVRRGLRGPVHP